MSSSNDPSKLILTASPHIKQTTQVEVIMRNVVFAILPMTAYSIYAFGLSALALNIVVLISCLLTEHLFNRLSNKPSTLFDYSGTITGLLLALTLPPGLPLWMGAIAGFIAIGMGKSLFGGLGLNMFNPALVGRAFAQAAFPLAMTTWSPAFAIQRFESFIPSSLSLPFTKAIDSSAWINASGIDSFSGATPLGLSKFDGITTEVSDLFWGLTSGSIGETQCLIIIAGGVYLALRNFLNWRIPVAVLLSAFVTSLILNSFNPDEFAEPLFMLFSGGLMLGAVFMATDMVGSPVTPKGVWVFGILIGFLTIIIREFSGLTEGVMYAILFANAATPLIETYTQPRVFGRGKNNE